MLCRDRMTRSALFQLTDVESVYCLDARDRTGTRRSTMPLARYFEPDGMSAGECDRASRVDSDGHAISTLCPPDEPTWARRDFGRVWVGKDNLGCQTGRSFPPSSPGESRAE